MWYSLDKKNKITRQGVIKLRLGFSSEKNPQVAAQEHKHLLRILLLHELETSKVFKSYIYIFYFHGFNTIIYLGCTLLVVWNLQPSSRIIDRSTRRPIRIVTDGYSLGSMDRLHQYT